MAYRLGVDLGGTTIKAGVVDEKKRMVCHVSLPTGADRPFETVVADMAAAAKQAAAQAGLDMGDFPCVGFGMPGLIDLARGIHVFAGNLGWHNVPITAELQRHFSIPVLSATMPTAPSSAKRWRARQAGFPTCSCSRLAPALAAASS